MHQMVTFLLCMNCTLSLRNKIKIEYKCKKNLYILMTHSHVHVFVQLGSKVAWHLATAVVVSVILGDVVNIMED